MMSPTPLGGAPGGDWVRLHEKGGKEHKSRPITISIATSLLAPPAGRRWLAVTDPRRHPDGKKTLYASAS